MSVGTRLAAVALAIGLAPGCLVLSVNRFYDEAAIVFDERLLGVWREVDDGVSVTVERSEWRSYRLTYVHPVETGQLTAYLFESGATRFLDLTPVRGEDPGSFRVPMHAVVRVAPEGDELRVSGLSFDWFDAEIDRPALAGLGAVRAERDQILLTSPTDALRRWLAGRPASDAAFGAETTFRREKGR